MYNNDTLKEMQKKLIGTCIMHNLYTEQIIKFMKFQLIFNRLLINSNCQLTCLINDSFMCVRVSVCVRGHVVKVNG